MATTPTVSELRKGAEITDQEIDAAVDAYIANPEAEPYCFASGDEIDVPPRFIRTSPPRRLWLMLIGQRSSNGQWSAPRSCWRIQ